MKYDNRYQDLMWELVNHLDAQSDTEEVPVAAMVLNPNLEMLSLATNQRINQKDASAHAEIEAIRQAGKKINNWRLDDYTILVTLEPCMMCAGAILQSRISRVVFGAYETKSGFLISKVNPIREVRPQLEIIGGVLEQECAEVLSKWFKKHRSSEDILEI